MKSQENINFKFAKTSKKLPVVLSRREIEKILQAISNQKHKLMIALAYGSGLRISEVISLRAQDIDFEEELIHL